MTDKNPKTRTIEISTETYERLYRVKKDLAKILHKKSVSFDTAFKLFYVAQPLDLILSDLILETAKEAT